MKKIKLCGSFAFFLCLIVSCLTLPCVAVADFPDLFATPTPTPTAPPDPTPTPTPKPEPTAWPALDIKVISSAQATNLKVHVIGTLTYNNIAIPNASVYVGYSADDGVNWQNFSWVQTRNDGTYGTVWLPNDIGNYKINAHWEGNDTLHWLDATADLALTSDSDGNEFSAVSNSTISNLSYNTATQKLAFNVNGTSETGYVYLTIPKSLVSSTHIVEVRVDGTPIEFATESQNDVWVLFCTYGEGEYSFIVQVPFVDSFSPDDTPWTLIYAVVVVAVLVIVVAVLLAVRRRRRTASTVAAILKENRPTY